MDNKLDEINKPTSCRPSLYQAVYIEPKSTHSGNFKKGVYTVVGIEAVGRLKLTLKHSRQFEKIEETFNYDDVLIYDADQYISCLSSIS